MFNQNSVASVPILVIFIGPNQPHIRGQVIKIRTELKAQGLDPKIVQTPGGSQTEIFLLITENIAINNFKLIAVAGTSRSINHGRLKKELRADIETRIVFAPNFYKVAELVQETLHPETTVRI